MPLRTPQDLRLDLLEAGLRAGVPPEDVEGWVRKHEQFIAQAGLVTEAVLDAARDLVRAAFDVGGKPQARPLGDRLTRLYDAVCALDDAR